MKLSFYEFEKEKNELYGQFYLELNVEFKPKETYNIVLIILCDKDSRALKEINILKEYFFDEEHGYNETITDSYELKFDIQKFVEALFNNTADCNFNGNFFSNCHIDCDF